MSYRSTILRGIGICRWRASFGPDIVQLEKNARYLQQIFATSYDVLFNVSKSKLLYCGQAVSRPTLSSVSFTGVTIELVSQEKHLGNVIGQNCVKFKIEDCINIFTGRTNMIRIHFCHARYAVIYYIFKTYYMPLYGLSFRIMVIDILIGFMLNEEKLYENCLIYQKGSIKYSKWTICVMLQISFARQWICHKQ
jgi:hypothetical protein